MLGYDSVEELLTRNMLDLYRSPEDRAALLATGAHQRGHRRSRLEEGPYADSVRLAARIIEGSEQGVTRTTIAEDASGAPRATRQARK
jgi:hypothetical protein